MRVLENPVEFKVFELEDTAGFNQWKLEHPNPTPDEFEQALYQFFKHRADMTKEDFDEGNDPRRHDDI